MLVMYVTSSENVAQALTSASFGVDLQKEMATRKMCFHVKIFYNSNKPQRLAVNAEVDVKRNKNNNNLGFCVKTVLFVVYFIYKGEEKCAMVVYTKSIPTG